ncbi:MAG: PH domain-containing protein [Gemmatimonadales bacterium]|nr:PH domain-containing protein [Gemmatimonadales bacterium]MYG50359.1 PH domain-containing protein [Gemmatimonadales bacterium]MYK00386.1 PH domain-containing protein [Candidatus Palauibacter ramosifaciens]
MVAEPTDAGPAEDPAPAGDSPPAEPEAPAGSFNPEVPLHALPGAEAVDWVPLHPRFARRLQVGAFLRSVVYVAAAGGLHITVLVRNPGAFAAAAPWLPAFLWTLLATFSVWSVIWPLIAVPRRGYVVREKDLLYKSGVLWRSVKAFPFNRVQHTKLDSTPLDRRFGLAGLSVFPAGGGRGNRIRGLGQETAERLRAYISERIESGAGTAEGR